MARAQRAGLLIVLAAGLVSLATLVAGASPVPRLAASAWVIPAAPRSADAIVILGGGVTWPGALQCQSLLRLQRGVELYRQGYAPRVIVTGGVTAPDAAVPTEAKLMRQLALTMGVKPDDIVVEDRATRTYENAVRVAAIMRRGGWRSAVLVTDPVHMRRARLVFERVGILTHPAPSLMPGNRPTPGEGLTLLEDVAYEVLATVVYKLRGWV
ncbi:MAG: YdcF family protein [Candidatus Rokubacteria bacterium]|nr:YdcF family protein [Candidatus Rokubacteria bacterium]